MISVSICASFACTSWYCPIGLPNMMRLFEYSAAEWKHAMAAPTTPNAMPKRACVRQPSGPFSPSTFGSSAVSGTCTSWRISSLVTEARSECLRFCSGAENPLVFVSMMKPRIESFPLASSLSFAHTIATCAIVPFVIHILAPFRT